jgi:peptide-methionine (S)-S-oxide reductase
MSRVPRLSMKIRLGLPRQRLALPIALISASIAPVAGVTKDAARATPPSAVVVLAGGCYWGVESVFRHVRGVVSATSGYALPARPGSVFVQRVEAVRLVYDPARLSYSQILDVFFTVAHDPTELDRQGPDVGPQYRSMVFVDNDRQRNAVRAYVDSLDAARLFPRPIVTEIAALRSFQVVEASQQDYAARHPTDPYIVANDAPKVEALRRRFPRLYRD